MAKRTPPCEAYPEWTTARFNAFITSALRSAWNRWPVKYEILKQGRRSVAGKKWKWEHQCASCGGWFQQKEIDIDHIDPIGSCKTWDETIERMFVGIDKLQKLCKQCHSIKTKEERKR